MYKKIKFTIFCIIISALFVLLISECYTYRKFLKIYNSMIEGVNNVVYSQYPECRIDSTNCFLINSKYSFKTTKFDEIKSAFNKQIGLKYQKKPILIVGCSFAFGSGLKLKETFHYKLSQLTLRPVYNRAVGGGGVQHIYYQLLQPDFFNLIPEPEYVIYVYIPDHIRRLYQYQSWNIFDTQEYLRYKVENQKITRIHPVLFKFWFLYTVKNIQNLICLDKCHIQNQKYYFSDFRTILNTSKSIIQNKYPNTKFVILRYPQNYTKIDESNWNRLKDDGFIVIKSDELTNSDLLADEYKLVDKLHPSEKAWNEITPALVKKLKL